MEKKTYKLIGPDGKPYISDQPGTLGGHNKLKIYGRLDCPSAKRYIAKGSTLSTGCSSRTKLTRRRQATVRAGSA